VKTFLRVLPHHHQRACAYLDDLATRTLRRRPTAWEQGFVARLQQWVTDDRLVTRRQWETLRGIAERVL